MAVKTGKVAYTTTAPWRGQGVQVKPTSTVKEMMRAAEIDFSIERRAIYRQDGSTIEGFHELAKAKSKQTFDICGSRYIPTQPVDAMNFFADLTKKGKAKMELMGSLMDDRIVWALAAVQEDITLPSGDKLRPYLFLASPAIQGKSLIARLTMKRDVCNNTLSIALRRGKNGIGDTFRMNHRNEFNDVQQEEARRVIGVAREQAQTFASTAAKLSKKRMSADKAREIITETFGDQTRRIESIMEAYTNAPGAEPGTAWGVVNAVTYWADHLAGKSEDRRLTNAWLGRNAAKKIEVLERVSEA